MKLLKTNRHGVPTNELTLFGKVLAIIVFSAIAIGLIFFYRIIAHNDADNYKKPNTFVGVPFVY